MLGRLAHKPKEFELGPYLDRLLLTFLDIESLACYMLTNKIRKTRLKNLINSMSDPKYPHLIQDVKVNLFTEFKKITRNKYKIDFFSQCRLTIQKYQPRQIQIANRVGDSVIMMCALLGGYLGLQLSVKEPERSRILDSGFGGLFGFVFGFQISSYIRDSFGERGVEIGRLSPELLSMLEKALPFFNPDDSFATIKERLHAGEKELKTMQLIAGNSHAFKLFHNSLKYENKAPEQKSRSGLASFASHS